MTLLLTTPNTVPQLTIPQLPKGKWVVGAARLDGLRLILQLRGEMDDTLTRAVLSCGTDRTGTELEKALCLFPPGQCVTGETLEDWLDTDDDGWMEPATPGTLARVSLGESAPGDHEITLAWYTPNGVEKAVLSIHKSSLNTATKLTVKLRSWLREPENLGQYLEAREEVSAFVEKYADSPRGVSVDGDLTVAWAIVGLERNTRNRPIKDAELTTLYNELVDPKIGPQETGDCICFHPDGSLANGQHRCIVTSMAELTIPVAFRFALPYSSQESQDRGGKRTVAQHTDQKYKGEGLPSGTAVDAMFRMTVRYGCDGGSVGTSTRAPYNNYVEMYLDSLKLVAPILADDPGGVFKMVGVRAAFVVALNSVHRETVLEVARAIRSGANLAEDSVPLKLREGITKAKDAKKAPDQRNVMGWVLHVLYLYVQGAVRVPSKLQGLIAADEFFCPGKRFFGTFDMQPHLSRKPGV